MDVLAFKLLPLSCFLSLSGGCVPLPACFQLLPVGFPLPARFFPAACSFLAAG
jgi:hypothetical protein